MHIRRTSVSIALGLLASTLPAFAEGVHIHTSTSSNVESTENGTITKRAEARVLEEHSDGNATSVQRWHSVSCINGKCIENTSDKHDVTRSQATVATNGGKKSWRERMQARLARRVCRRFTNEDRDQCLDDAERGSGLAMREKLRMWISRL